MKNLYLEIISRFNPWEVFKRDIRYDEENDILKIRKNNINLRGNNIFVFGAGKSSTGMSEGIIRILKNRIKGGLVVTNLPLKTRKLNNINFVKGSHPLPDKNSLNSGKRIYEMISKTRENDIVIFLISGGGSDMMVFPEDRITLKDYIDTIEILKRCGAHIGEINIIRKKIDRVKGGKLRFISKSKRFINILFSDVPGINDDIRFIASGPVFEDTTSFKEAYEILQRYKIEGQVPVSVRNFLKRSIKRKVKIDRNIFKNDLTFLMAKNRDVLKFIAEYFLNKGFYPLILKKTIKEEVNIEKEYLLRKILKYINQKGSVLIAGGEPTVRIDIKISGEGGRMSHLLLLLLKEFIKRKIKNISFLLVGTDGIDGNSDIAGGIISMKEIINKIKLEEVDNYIKNFDSANFLKKYKLDLKTGYTGINLADVMVFLIE